MLEVEQIFRHLSRLEGSPSALFLHVDYYGPSVGIQHVGFREGDYGSHQHSSKLRNTLIFNWFYSTDSQYFPL